MLEPHERATALIGTRFRAQGRNPASGLDCVGLVICAFDLSPVELPRYRLTDGDWDGIERALRPWFDRCMGNTRPSDVVVFRMPRCFHFGVLGKGHLVHADLTIGRVVARQLPAPLSSDARHYRYREGDV